MSIRFTIKQIYNEAEFRDALCETQALHANVGVCYCVGRQVHDDDDVVCLQRKLRKRAVAVKCGINQHDVRSALECHVTREVFVVGITGARRGELPPPTANRQHARQCAMYRGTEHTCGANGAEHRARRSLTRTFVHHEHVHTLSGQRYREIDNGSRAAAPLRAACDSDDTRSTFGEQLAQHERLTQDEILH